jgi:hypothetical protein
MHFDGDETARIRGKFLTATTIRGLVREEEM